MILRNKKVYNALPDEKIIYYSSVFPEELSRVEVKSTKYTILFNTHGLVIFYKSKNLISYDIIF